VIVIIAWLLQSLASRLIGAFRVYMSSRLGNPDESRRVTTLERVFHHVATVVIAIVAGTLVLGELGVSVAPILATAGVAGIAIGFGAQSLVKDYFTGFFLLLEDQIRQGDVVQIGDMGGVVEIVTLRYVRLRNVDGHVHFIPNGEIKTLTNRTRDFAQVMLDIGVDYGADLDAALGALRDVGRELRDDPAFGGRIADDIEISGVERFADSAVILRCRLKVVPPLEQWNVRRELLRRIKIAFDARGIRIPFPHVTFVPAKEEQPTPPVP